MWRGFEVMRAAAIALYVVFVVLAVLAMRRGLRAGGMLLGVSVVFLLLVRTDWYDPGTKWLAAVVLTAIAAASMTKRLVHAMPTARSGQSMGLRPTLTPTVGAGAVLPLRLPARPTHACPRWEGPDHAV